MRILLESKESMRNKQQNLLTLKIINLECKEMTIMSKKILKCGTQSRQAKEKLFIALVSFQIITKEL